MASAKQNTKNAEKEKQAEATVNEDEVLKVASRARGSSRNGKRKAASKTLSTHRHYHQGEQAWNANAGNIRTTAEFDKMSLLQFRCTANETATPPTSAHKPAEQEEVIVNLRGSRAWARRINNGCTLSNRIRR